MSWNAKTMHIILWLISGISPPTFFMNKVIPSFPYKQGSHEKYDLLADNAMGTDVNRADSN